MSMNSDHLNDTNPRTDSGAALAHDSAKRHVTGEAQYIDDMPARPNELSLALAISNIAHGDLLNVDTREAQAIDGVVAAFVAGDVPGKLDIGPVFAGDPLLAQDTIEFLGQPLAAIVATSEDVARRAAMRVSSDTVTREPLLSLEAALEQKSYVTPPHTIRRGNPEAALMASKNRLVDVIESGAQDHFYLEGQISLAIPEEDGSLSIYASTQNPTETQKLVADVLGKPMNAITVYTRRMGGGFGGKETQSAQMSCLAALAAAKLNRPVRARLPRALDMITTGKRHDFRTTYSVGYDDDGRITALIADLSARCGYSPDLSAAIVDRALFHMDNCYYLENAQFTGHPLKTNTVSNTAFRGFGGPQGMFVIENILDTIARRLGVDPVEIRKRNFYGPAPRNITPYGQTLDDNPYPALVADLCDEAEYDTRRADIEAFNAASPIIKKGIALSPVKFGISFTARHLNQAGALVHIYHDGSVHLNHGGTEMGQGLFIKVAQIVSEELGINVGRIAISTTQTDKVPNTSPTAASAGTDLNGMAALRAARKLKGRLLQTAAAHFDCAIEDVNLKDDQATAAEQSIDFDELVHMAYMNRVSLSATGFYRTPKIWYDRESSSGRPFFYFAGGVAISEVLVDTLTGETRLLRADLLQDAGYSLNPAIDLGQVEGGYIQGLGWLTSEEIVFDERGALTTTGPATYKIPAIGDAPIEFNVKLAPNSPNCEPTVYRSKAVGEPPLMLAISAFLAIKDAVSSVDAKRRAPILDAPATPERVLASIDELKSRY